jgi:dipeptidyl aminopeptidase/acylaminoacyl peptidase
MAPYGAWVSEISAELATAKTTNFGRVQADNGKVYWLEGRPTEGGRTALVCRDSSGEIQDVLPAEFNVRTRVNEYGGGAYTVQNNRVVFSNFSDNRLYYFAEGMTSPRPLTPNEPTMPGAPAQSAFTYADISFDDFSNQLIAVREDHRTAGDVKTEIVYVSLQGEPDTVIVKGDDFYASPVLSPDGQRLAWVSWNHPNMPWDNTELWVADLGADGEILSKTLIAGGDCSVVQPQWSPDGKLFFVSDASNWWNIYYADLFQSATPFALAQLEAEFARPQWILGEASFVFVESDLIVATYAQNGEWQLVLISADFEAGQHELLPMNRPSAYKEFSSLALDGKRLVMLAGAPDRRLEVVQFNLETSDLMVLKRASCDEIPGSLISQPRSIVFPTADGDSAYGFLYLPRNGAFEAPLEDKPPLIVFSHGGPTAATSSTLKLTVQYFTSRGYAVVDVNYRGSTGYGRAYRRRLYSNWGIVDVQDCQNAAKYLVEQGLVDPERLIIRGGSAGGFTTLACLTFGETFKAGASLFGVSDLVALTLETHKFESRYLETLVGPYPQEASVYIARSPINHVERLKCPVIFFQGTEDKIVPPNQSAAMYEALRSEGIATAYLLFEGEEHGFRQSANCIKQLEAELAFYNSVFGIQLPEGWPEVAIVNLGSGSPAQPPAATAYGVAQ